MQIEPRPVITAYVQEANQTMVACIDVRRTRECRDGKARMASLYEGARAKLKYERGNKLYLARHYDQWNTLVRRLPCGEGQDAGQALAPELARLHQLEAELH